MARHSQESPATLREQVDELGTGVLVRPFGTLSVPTADAYWIITRTGGEARADDKAVGTPGPPHYGTAARNL